MVKVQNTKLHADNSKGAGQTVLCNRASRTGMTINLPENARLPCTLAHTHAHVYPLNNPPQDCPRRFPALEVGVLEESELSKLQSRVSSIDVLSLFRD
jgi:hypothetical protein